MKITKQITLNVMISILIMSTLMIFSINIISKNMFERNYKIILDSKINEQELLFEKELFQDTNIIDTYFNLYNENIVDNKKIQDLEKFFLKYLDLEKKLGIYIKLKDGRGVMLSDYDKDGIYTKEKIDKNIDYFEGWSLPESDKGITEIKYQRVLYLNGREYGVIGIEFDYDKIYTELKKREFYKSGYYALLDSKFNFIYHPNIDLNNKNIFNVNGIEGLEKKQFLKTRDILEYKYLGKNKTLFYSKLKNNWILIGAVETSDLKKDLKNLQNTTLLIVILIVLFTYFIVDRFSRKFTKPIINIVNKIKVAAKGELSVRIESSTTNEFMALVSNFNFFIEKLDKVISVIKNEAQSIGNSAEEMNMANEDLAKKTSEQAASLEDNSSTMKQIGIRVNNNVAQTILATEKVKEIVTNTLRIEEASKELKSSMENINESSKQIEDITEIIDEIAFQTNILALNAAVEAARAGEQGRGFAVVASEIRALSKKSSESAKKINKRIKVTVDKIEKGNELVNETTNSISEISEKIHEMNKIIQNIRDSVDEQRLDIEVVDRIIADLEAATQSNASTAEEVSTAMTVFYQKIQEFIMQVEQFKVTGEKKEN
ncbi:methyl-accepting chemotaxis sensory transducer with Cache sensor [Hypnocyclicus thermotrophus]|uniref:Methyl-accepting chemotaxis sensory transducer with Cache sensor n=1 Tax=Hypnocyclicus thermotrophus TaxID=1627895 RepID=A0AA46I509_9FUSO|nr:methyl-accepting chemotaxis protein [Hypnocyclicus thermotrophus]TDT68100.1 methyl-accepting chemotaxis sensory transducer with Cache sensor [Hypnocyclicus thermotrophus]